MTRKPALITGTVVALGLAVGLSNPFPARVTAQQPASGLVPKFTVDRFWPKPLPNRWLLGQVSGVAVDAQDHVWSSSARRR